jgi:tRNA A37 N6-isopentenylltransferase MiaA
MLDIVLLRKDLDAAVARLQTRKNPQAFLNVEAFRALEGERKTLQTRTEELQSQRNTLSKQIGMFKGFDFLSDLQALFLSEILERGIFATRQLAKRQITWLRSMAERTVVKADAPEALTQVLQTAMTLRNL